ncbi:hypothetical protein CA13_36310 [Planctomycetes bacterium CA13]|uniref:DUF1475 domain-containing protein n=1 Tax=Novipirellula herctigrandis TaxID=2527986 RepID=A0A5C5Z4Q0_9BACT|nr:hypothetical protein CA13_36310 [Planctomycetes bacterium CA13]
MNRTQLVLLFSMILIVMLAVTTYASLDRSVLKVGSEILLDRWFIATLCDAYLGFLTFYVWVAYKETAWWKRITWFVLIMLLGNIAMAIYVLIQLSSYDQCKGIESVLLRKSTCSV